MSRSRERSGAAHSPGEPPSDADFEAIKKRKKFFEKNRKKVLTTEIECVILAKLSPRDRAKEPKKS